MLANFAPAAVLRAAMRRGNTWIISKESVILLMVSAMPAAAPPVSSPDSDLCLAAGSLTYRISRSASVADLRVKIDPQASNPDLRTPSSSMMWRARILRWSTTPSAAPAAGCAGRGSKRPCRSLPISGPADLTVALFSDPADAPLRLYLHSAWLGPEHAAALYAAMRHFEQAGLPSATDAESQDAGW